MGENKERCCNPLEIMLLSDFNIQHDATVTLSTLLPHCTSLKELSLTSNNFGDDGCLELCKNLGSLTRLKELYLSFNNLKIGNTG